MSRRTALIAVPATIVAVAGVGAASTSADTRSKGKASHRSPAPAKQTGKKKKATTPAKQTTTPTTPAPATSPLQKGLVACANTERAKVGLPALVEDAALARAAQGHAADMDANNYFDHTSQDGRTPWDRINASLGGEQPFTAMGENIAMDFDTPDATCTGWMNSPPHRANILNRTYKMIGTGWADGYAVQDFGAR